MRKPSRAARRCAVWALAALPVVGVIVALSLMLAAAGPGDAEAAGASPDMVLAGQGLNCDTDPNTPAPSTCNVPVGTQFTILGDLNKIAGLFDAEGDTIAGYEGLQWHIVTTAGLTLKERPPPVPSNQVPEIVWPDCGIRAESNISPQNRLIGCDVGFAFGSTFLGRMMEMDVNCVTLGTQTITSTNAGPADSYITNENGAAVPDTGSPAEVLTVNCTPPDGVIQIDKVDGVTGQPLGGACFVIEALSQPLFLDRVSDNNAKTNADCDQPGLLGLELTDSNPNPGEIDVTIPGSARFLSNVWRVLETQAPPKYDLNPISYGCTFGPDVCSLVIPNSRLAGNAHITFNDSFTGGAVPDQCVDGFINPPLYDVQAAQGCDGGPEDTDPDPGELGLVLSLDSYSIKVDPVALPPNRQVTPPDKALCDLSATAPECEIKFTYQPVIPFNLKLPTLQNLLLTAQGAKLPPATCQASTDVAVFTHSLSNLPTTPDPKDPSQVQRIGAFELGVRADPKLVCVTFVPGQYAVETGMICFGGGSSIGCVTKGKDPPSSSSLELAKIFVRPQPELYSLIRANQDNGVIAQILNQDCNLADLQGHPIQKIGCDDGELTIRFLEGDVNGDCAVDVADQQLLAFRWGAEVGNQLYNPRFDLEPSGQIKGDGDLDIKDVQFVFGRHGSTCDVPWPAQPPLNGKLTNP